MPFSCANRRIQRSERIVILLFPEVEGLLDEPAPGLNRTPRPAAPDSSLARACALRRLRFSRKAAARRRAF